MTPPPMILPKNILLTSFDNFDPREMTTYAQADEAVQKIAAAVMGRRVYLRVIVVFTDLLVWTTSLSVAREDATAENFIQRAIRADWEFNAGVRPPWWPKNPEADRIWGVHFREDRDGRRAELARARLERYDLGPVILNPLPPRNSASLWEIRPKDSPLTKAEWPSARTMLMREKVKESLQK